MASPAYNSVMPIAFLLRYSRDNSSNEVGQNMLSINGYGLWPSCGKRRLQWRISTHPIAANAASLRVVTLCGAREIRRRGAGRTIGAISAGEMAPSIVARRVEAK